MSRLKRQALAAALALMLSCLLQPAVQAQVNSYTNAGSGAWETGANWSSGVPPTNTESVFITNGAYGVSLTDTSSTSWMTVSNLTVSSSSAGPNLLINFTDQSKNFTVGSGAGYGNVALGTSSGQSGTLTVSNGNFSARSVLFGAIAGSTGTWHIVGGTNTLRATSDYGLKIGGNTSGGLGGVGYVQMDGGVLTVSGDSGSTLAIGNGSSTGVGILTLNNGTVTSSAMRVGNAGTGTLNVFGGTNIATTLTVGRFGTGSGTMLMTGGYVQAGSLEIGSDMVSAGVAQGLLTMSNGMLVVSSTTYLGKDASSVGTWNMDGGTSTVSSAMYMGNALGSTGSILLVGGSLAVTNTSGTAQLVVGASGRGRFTMNGGVLTVDRLLVTNGASSSFSASGGSLAARTSTIGGAFSLTNSTGTFSSNLTVTGSGSLSGTNGAFVLYGNFIDQSTNRTSFDLSRSTVLFTNGVAGMTNHTFDLTGSGAVDMGSNWLNVAQLATNFSIGTLSIASGNRLTLMGTNFSSGITNALYVGGLDLSTWDTSTAGLTNTLMAALSLTNINLYYDAGDSRNAYLQDASYTLWGSGGLLIPIPEPSTTGLILGGALFSAWLLRRKGGRR